MKDKKAFILNLQSKLHLQLDSDCREYNLLSYVAVHRIWLSTDKNFSSSQNFKGHFKVSCTPNMTIQDYLRVN